MLGLGHDEQGDDHIHDNQHFIEHPGAYLVFVSVTQEMHHARDGGDDKKGKDEHEMQVGGHHCFLPGRERYDACQMGRQCERVALEDEVA